MESSEQIENRRNIIVESDPESTNSHSENNYYVQELQDQSSLNSFNGSIGTSYFGNFDIGSPTNMNYDLEFQNEHDVDINNAFYSRNLFEISQNQRRYGHVFFHRNTQHDHEHLRSQIIVDFSSSSNNSSISIENSQRSADGSSLRDFFIYFRSRLPENSTTRENAISANNTQESQNDTLLQSVVSSRNLNVNQINVRSETPPPSYQQAISAYQPTYLLNNNYSQAQEENMEFQNINNINLRETSTSYESAVRPSWIENGKMNTKRILLSLLCPYLFFSRILYNWCLYGTDSLCILLSMFILFFFSFLIVFHIAFFSLGYILDFVLICCCFFVYYVWKLRMYLTFHLKFHHSKFSIFFLIFFIKMNSIIYGYFTLEICLLIYESSLAYYIKHS